jgi:CRP-like cAMP-binding protein
MTSQQAIIDYINKFVAITPEEAILFASTFKQVKFKKRQLIVQPNFVTKHRYFIVCGAVKAYVIGREGQEHSVQLAVDEWWISDYNSYILQQPATMFVMPVEDTTALQIGFEDEQKLKAANHKFETFFRIIAERGSIYAKKIYLDYYYDGSRAIRIVY